MAEISLFSLGETHMSTVWISIVLGALTVTVGGLSITLGYLLFVKGATGAFKFGLTSGEHSVKLEALAPGILFALFGAGLCIFTIFRFS